MLSIVPLKKPLSVWAVKALAAHCGRSLSSVFITPSILIGFLFAQSHTTTLFLTGFGFDHWKLLTHALLFTCTVSPHTVSWPWGPGQWIHEFVITQSVGWSIIQFYLCASMSGSNLTHTPSPSLLLTKWVLCPWARFSLCLWFYYVLIGFALVSSQTAVALVHCWYAWTHTGCRPLWITMSELLLLLYACDLSLNRWRIVCLCVWGHQWSLSLQAARWIKGMDLIRRNRACREVNGYVLWLVGSGSSGWEVVRLLHWHASHSSFPHTWGQCAQHCFSLQAISWSDRVKDKTKTVYLHRSPIFWPSLSLRGVCIMARWAPVLFLSLCFVKSTFNFHLCDSDSHYISGCTNSLTSDFLGR